MPQAFYSTAAVTERSALTSRRIPGATTVTDRVPLDLAAFEALYLSHGARMKSLALNVLGNRSDAEDAVQETFLRAYKNRHSFRSDAALWTWVYRILLNACHDIGRSRVARRDSQMVDADVAVDIPTPAGDNPMRLTLQRAVDGLAPIYRDVFLLCEVEGYTHREVAGILEIPEGTSKGRLFEARRQLKLTLAGRALARRVETWQCIGASAATTSGATTCPPTRDRSTESGTVRRSGRRSRPACAPTIARTDRTALRARPAAPLT
jgi:RNA polymerase sigma-70 factor (ECF subfamily)